VLVYVWDHAGGSDLLVASGRLCTASIHGRTMSWTCPGREKVTSPSNAKQRPTGVKPTSLTVTIRFTTFDGWWERLTPGLEAAGAPRRAARRGAARRPP
jgi:hypothetical protein